MKKYEAGFSLIELVIFIVIIGIVVSSVFLAFSTSSQKSPFVNAQVTANLLAGARMDIILGQRRLVGFTSFTDPCVSSPPAVCTVPAGITGYTTTSTISTLTIGGDSNYKSINVTVTGPQNSKTVLKTFVGKYQ